MAKSITSGSGLLKTEVQGASRLARTLRQAGDDLEDLKDANARAAKIVEEGTLGLVPVRTGWLASTIRSTGTKAAGFIRAGGKLAPYAGPIHWGWPKRNIKPNPFAADAAKLTEPVWGRIYQDAVNKAIQRIQGA